MSIYQRARWWWKYSLSAVVVKFTLIVIVICTAAVLLANLEARDTTFRPTSTTGSP